MQISEHDLELAVQRAYERGWKESRKYPNHAYPKVTTSTTEGLTLDADFGNVQTTGRLIFL